MKPSQPNIEYCIEHREFVNGLLEKKGGGEPEDRIIQTKEGRGVWLPSEGDVLAMLDERKYMPALESSIRIDQADLIWMAYAGRFNSGWHDTPLIALLELLRAVEENDGL